MEIGRGLLGGEGCAERETQEGPMERRGGGGGPSQRGGQIPQLLMPPDSPEALLRPQQRNYHPPRQLISLPVPPTHLAERPAKSGDDEKEVVAILFRAICW